MSETGPKGRGAAGRHAITALKLGVTGALLVWVFSLADLDAVLAQLGRLNPVYGLAAVLAHCLQFPIGAYRWRMILADDGVSMSFRDSFSYLMIGILFNQVLPSTIGGDGARVWLSARTGIGWSRAFGAVAVDRAAAIFMVLVLSVPLLPVLLPILPEGAARSSLAGLILIGVAAVAVILPTAPWIVRLVMARLPDRRILRPFEAAARSSAVLWRRGATTSKISIASVAILSSHVTTVWLIAHAIGIPLDLLQVFALVLPVMLLLAVPISIAGWGLREGLMVTALGFLGVAPSAAVTISLLWGVITLFGGALGGVALAMDRTNVSGLFGRAGAQRPEEEGSS
ncbi:MAG: flippase-like domain-containing protein [Alphaproteobacteria bacterium]|nr:flippase-like domain-containing protein [Alphaproteobacteria bacterium]